MITKVTFASLCGLPLELSVTVEDDTPKTDFTDENSVCNNIDKAIFGSSWGQGSLVM